MHWHFETASSKCGKPILTATHCDICLYFSKCLTLFSYYFFYRNIIIVHTVIIKVDPLESLSVCFDWNTYLCHFVPRTHVIKKDNIVWELIPLCKVNKLKV